MKPWRGEAVARTAAAVAVAAALSLAACSSNGAPPAGGNSALGEAPAGMGGSGDPGAPPSPAPTPEPISTVVQAKGFLQAPDAGNGGSAEILPSSRVSEARINPCGGALPSDKQRVARAAAFVVYRFNDIPDSTPDGTAYEVISRYSGDGASAYLKDLRDAVSRCPSRTEGEISYTFAIADSGFAGDESVLVKETATYDFMGTEVNQEVLIAAVRLGQLIILIDAHGWEMSSAVRADVDRLVAAALVRAVEA
ncbi:MAG TPA: hypothetical protein VK028_14860 [Micromonosporaceae bacterium]|nr:hypothetical protein [Micromonosporaceae bacterium]